MAKMDINCTNHGLTTQKTGKKTRRYKKKERKIKPALIICTKCGNTVND